MGEAEEYLSIGIRLRCQSFVASYGLYQYGRQTVGGKLWNAPCTLFLEEFQMLDYIKVAPRSLFRITG